jgi:hypothetical protein
MADGASAISAGVATLTITGIGSTVAETFVAAATSVADAVASFMAAMAVTSTVAEASTAVTHSAAAASTAEEVFMVDTVGADSMVAVMAVDTGKLLDSSAPPDGRQHALPAVSSLVWTPRETRDQKCVRRGCVIGVVECG